ncbi:hypothetical protein [Natrinema sp. CGMCC1.2065]|uniref:hypothetical protein n=1 Tax=Natrinema sp. CGMCC1.2065 TaxID=3445767 RepID=UPI003F49D76A
MSSKMGRPPEAREATLEAIRELAAAGETDGANGGVATQTIAGEIDRGRKAVAKYCRRLREEEKIRRVHGLGPNGPRPSWLPVDGDGGGE